MIRWIDHQLEQKVEEEITWEGTTTDRYFYYRGAMRRLLINHTIPWPDIGIWQRDCEVEVLAND